MRILGAKFGDALNSCTKETIENFDPSQSDFLLKINKFIGCGADFEDKLKILTQEYKATEQQEWKRHINHIISSVGGGLIPYSLSFLPLGWESFTHYAQCCVGSNLAGFFAKKIHDQNAQNREEVSLAYFEKAEADAYTRHRRNAEKKKHKAGEVNITRMEIAPAYSN